MSLVELLEPILDGGLERNNFFNGRLLSAEDLRAEQDAERLRQSLIARSVGDGVGWGLGVDVANALPARVTVRAGFAMNRLGDLLRLADDAEVALVRTRPAANLEPTRFFAECENLPSSTFSNGDGAYVLTISPSSGFRETAPVSDPNTTAAGRGSCGARFSVEGVRFRLVRVAFNSLQGIGADLRTRIVSLLPPADDVGRARLRNLLAHACFGSPALGGAMASALELDLGVSGEGGWGLLDAMRHRGDLTDCDVPLAVVVLTSAGLDFVDVWPARRRLLDAGAISKWQGVASPRRVAEGEAAFLQFQSQLGAIKGLGSPATVAASRYLDVLPAGGWLPTGASGFTWTTFLGPHAPPEVTPVDAALLRGILERSWFDEPFALSTTPPVPIRVFEVPAQPFVVFARSSNGAIRVLLTPAPADSKQVDVTATALTGSVGRSTRRNGGLIRIPELVPGPHIVSISAPDFASVTPLTADVVGGRTVDLNVTLAPIPNGSIVVRPVDSSGATIATVRTITATGGGTVRDAVRQGGGNSWLLADMPPAMTYAITGSAAGYKTASSNAGPVALGQQVDVVLLFEKVTPVEDRPSKCIDLDKGMEPFPSKVRLCLVLQAAELHQAWFYRFLENPDLGHPDPAGSFAVKKRRAGQRAEGRFALEQGVILYYEPRWDRMTLVRAVPPEVTRWLLEWRRWLAKTTNDKRIDDKDPAIYVDVDNRSAVVSGVLMLPRAYAVFGPIGVPIAVEPFDRRTRAAIRLDEVEVFPARQYLEDLVHAGIRTVDDLVGSWTEFLADATGEEEDVVAVLIEEVAANIDRINEKFGYYGGVPESKHQKMLEAGYGDDVAIANAKLDELADVLGSKYLAKTTIDKARRIVPKESWSINFLGLPDNRVAGLRAIGVDSMGAFMSSTDTPAGKAALGKVLGLDAGTTATRDRELGVIANEAATAMAIGSITHAPATSLSKWAGVDAATAGKLLNAGFSSVEDVAAADPAALATAIGVAPAAAKKLVSDAGTEARSRLTVSVLGADATVGAVIDRTPAEIVTEFGGTATRATAILNGITVALARRNFR